LQLIQKKVVILRRESNYIVIMNTNANKQSNAAMALEKAMEVRRVWMQALSGKISKKELDAKGIRFMAVAE
jgi:hypothetical protein